MSAAGGWINFTAAVSLIFSVFFFIIFAFNFIHRLPGPWVLIDFVVQAVLCFLMTVSLIVAAASSYRGVFLLSRLKNLPNRDQGKYHH
nr:unnamed protein product [Spirometra erinaceieuropaei]